jgi:hypothetical protein
MVSATLTTIKFNRMSKRCELQKEYYKEFGNYKGVGKYSDHYVNWLESRILALTIPSVSKSFYCNNSENDYKDTICKEQCTICKWQEEAKQ